MTNENTKAVRNIDLEAMKLDVTDEKGKDKTIDCNSKSDMFRAMARYGMTVAEIAKATSSHYSFVHTVVSESGIKVASKKGPSKAQHVRELWAEGDWTVGNIAKELNMNYSYVHSIVKKYKQELAQEEASNE